MQWLKQTFAVRYNLLNGWTGHIWGYRYRSRIVASELPEEMERWSEDAVEELSPAGVAGSPISGKIRTRVSPFLGNLAKIPLKAASPPA
jgi:hypothetical protein